MEAITLPIYNTEGRQVDTIKLNSAVFDGNVNTDAIYQAVCAWRANQRKGLAATKTRGEVSGGGRKPWRQKGTGRARVGSIRSPLWRHGGVIFGPHPRDFYYKLPNKIKILALKSSLNLKVKDNNLMVLDKINLEKPKTREMAKIFSDLKISHQKKLLLLDKIDNNLKKAAANLSFLDIDLACSTNTYEVLSHEKLIITKGGLCELMNRFASAQKTKAAAEKNKIPEAKRP